MTLREFYEKAAQKGVRGVASSAAFRANHMRKELVKEAKRRTQGVLSPWRKGQVAMFHVGRSGSGVLGRCLKQHSQIYWGEEIFQYCREPYDPIAVLKEERLRAGRRYFGFEVKPFHLHHAPYSLPGHIDALRRHGVEHFVLLRRKNLLRKLVSSITASQYTSHISSTEERKRMSVHVNVDRVGDRQKRPLRVQIDRYLDEYETVAQHIKGEHALHLTYEDDIYESPMRAYRKVVDFLGEEYEEVEIKTKKTNPFPLHDLIANFEEVEARLKGTEHEWMLYA